MSCMDVHLQTSVCVCACVRVRVFVRCMHVCMHRCMCDVHSVHTHMRACHVWGLSVHVFIHTFVYPCTSMCTL